MKTFLKFVVVILLGAALTFGAVKLVRLRKEQLARTRIAPVRTVPVVPGRITRGDFLLVRPYIGVLGSNRQASLQARVSAQVTQVLHREGEAVRRGDPLVELDGTPSAPRGSRLAAMKTLEHQEKALADSEKTRRNLLSILERTRGLFRKKMASLDQVQLLENQVEAVAVRISDLKRALANAREKLDFFTIRALFDGRISRVLVNPGDLVMPGRPVLEMEDPSPCKITVSVSTEDLPRLKAGLQARVTWKGKALTVPIARVYPSADRSGVGTVELDLPEPPFGLPLGASVTVEIPVRRIPDVLLAPEGGVLQGPEKATVFKIVEGRIRVVPVRVLGASPTQFALEGPLSPGDEIVTGSDSLLLRLTAGTKVEKAESPND